MSGALAITVDVDGEAGLPGGGLGYAHRLTSRSERVYGLRCGLPRILSLLDEFAVRATFYVPGVTALRHPQEVAAIVEAGHELGHHGHTHRRPDTLDDAEQRAEIEQGLEALSPFGPRPLGYRAPGWELTPVTLALLDEYGFRWDSSLMGEDRPYLAAGTLVELPVHWSLDDAPYYAASLDGGGILAVWQRAVELAAKEDRPVTLTLHPEILGRPERAHVLREVLTAAARHDLAVHPHSELAGLTQAAPESSVAPGGNVSSRYQSEP
ncbi:polysaccharide deacetylase family protein [Solirubrobacter phytolaccae]|uniref:Polysaccharide deacetylase family protein n=1 Tax=Solirubrobacter phytolaccae TaxID=1404360 RepID=A0A9X3NDZ0_9ACTN|nr:polysaccharide deacetylase family protein [Solirubrobacter phytolaccae]MDA0184364.1 polysaccharide deacetylase family protein [Solirubrobacter phytolaccae]